MENSLYTAPNNVEYLVKSVPDISLLHTLGIYEGSKITKKLSYGGGGPVLLVIDGREVAIGKAIGKEIIVTSELEVSQ